MSRESLLKRIAETRNDMIDLAAQVRGDNPFADALVYEKSCQLDELIVEFMRESNTERFEYLKVV